MKLSAFGEKFAGSTGIFDLMQDLGDALSNNPDMIFMGGGNPAQLPDVERMCHAHIADLLGSSEQWQRVLGTYQSPHGDRGLREHLASYLRSKYGWPVTAQNIAVANGSQSAYFILYNLFAGVMGDGSRRRIHLPLIPEYIGYADTGLAADFFSATRPEIELLDERQFKYHVDLAKLTLDDRVGALSVSRPTNPTGNVLTEAELEALESLAEARQIPLIVDGAYGPPFPNIVYGSATPRWNDNTILTLSLSKLGLPGLRTGIVVAREEIIHAFSSANTIINLASGSLGPVLLDRLLVSDDLDRLTRKHIRPYYEARMHQTLGALQAELADVPYRIHRPEGAFFLWLWFEGLPVSSAILYERLKKRGLLAIPGEDFFIGIGKDWAHSRECIRLSYAQAPETALRGIKLLGQEVRQAYNGA